MSKIGIFLKKHFQDKKLELYVGDKGDWYHYSDNESMSYVLIISIFKDYDEESGVVTLLSETGHTFWVSEDKIEMFWEHGKRFDIMKTSTSTIRSGHSILKNKQRDIMK